MCSPHCTVGYFIIIHITISIQILYSRKIKPLKIVNLSQTVAAHHVVKNWRKKTTFILQWRKNLSFSIKIGIMHIWKNNFGKRFHTSKSFIGKLDIFFVFYSTVHQSGSTKSQSWTDHPRTINQRRFFSHEATTDSQHSSVMPQRIATNEGHSTLKLDLEKKVSLLIPLYPCKWDRIFQDQTPFNWAPDTGP